MSRHPCLKSILGATIALAGATAVPGLAHGASTTSYSSLDKYLLQSGIQGDRFEIAGGRLAQTKGAAPEVRALGARLAKDHAKSLSDATKLARALGISVPKSPSPTQEWELQVVGGASGPGFDAAYAALEVQDHKQDIDDNKTEASEGSNPSVRRLARTDLPVLRTHLKLSQEALRVATGTS
jgi:putative membrane protein